VDRDDALPAEVASALVERPLISPGDVTLAAALRAERRGRNLQNFPSNLRRELLEEREIFSGDFEGRRALGTRLPAGILMKAGLLHEALEYTTMSPSTQLRTGGERLAISS